MPRKTLEGRQEYRRANKDRFHAYAKEYRMVHKDKVSKYNATYRAAHQDELNESNRERAQEKQYYLKRYGMTVDDYDEMLEAQGGVCAVCGRTNGSKRLAVDHNHETGEVRALLCDVCNHTLGKVHEDIEWLMRMVKYLEEHNA